MFDQRELISRVERADPLEFARILATPTLEEEEALRAHLGDGAYQRMHASALRVPATGSQRGLFDLFGRPAAAVAAKLGNVVVLPGIMGSELSVSPLASELGNTVWLNLVRVALGQIERLSLEPGGPGSAYHVRATGILKAYYGELALSTVQRWHTQTFWYDWRKSLNEAADQLRTAIDRWFGADAPVHLVAHSLGGLVCRTFIQRHPDRWRRMLDPDGGKRGGRLVMLGTPNYGSYLILQAVCGLASTVRKVAMVDQWHDVAGILRILNSFVGSFQLLPSPEHDPRAEPFYDAKTYGDLNIPQGVLDAARAHHKVLKDVIEPDRMVYVAGSNQPTLAGLSDPARLRDATAYLGTTQGDGSVSHALGLLKGVRTYFIESEHSALTSNPRVLASLDDLLQTGKTLNLAGGQAVRAAKREPADLAPWTSVGRSVIDRETAELLELHELSRTLQRRIGPAARRGPTVEEPPKIQEQRVSPNERVISDLITRDFLGSRFTIESAAAEPARERPSIEVRLVQGRIEQPDEVPPLELEGPPRTVPVDAVSVGHYFGVRPQAAELALDRALSRALSANPDQPPASTDLILTQFTDRGLLRGELGATFFLPMPGDGSRVLAIAGMGEVGGCGLPELTVLVRELCWALGRYGKTHLATVLIGSGNGNLSVRQCVESWIRGVKRALDDAQRENRDARLRGITFVEFDPLKVAEIQAAIQDVGRLQGHEIELRFEPLSAQQLTDLEQKGLDLQREHLEARLQARRVEIDRRREKRFDGLTTEPAPTRLTASMQVDPKDQDRVRYRFGALTDSASIPEREVTLSRVIVKNANDELAGETDLPSQCERGQFLGRLLIPQELTQHLSSTAPLVLQLDATSARIHWEMIAQPDPILPEENGFGATDLSSFLGTYRGLTRQLRTTFARPPEPTHNRQSVLRVLVVADPARDNPLPGAEEEGLAVSELFESFNTLADRENWPQRFQVTRLIGSFEATPTAVLRELSVRRYDVLHYAGHCFFDPQEPERSGWIFSDGVVISAHELQRIDRVPPLVVANACESGITPDRTGERSAAMVPSFAEAFFAQGVANYVGTAWPVDDIAARLFATVLYGALLGLEAGSLGESPAEIEPRSIRLTPQPMHLAILRARVAVARTLGGRGTWGAYQHYGNPYYRLLSNLPTGPGS